MKQCPKCHIDLLDNVKFCTKCGASLDEVYSVIRLSEKELTSLYGPSLLSYDYDNLEKNAESFKYNAQGFIAEKGILKGMSVFTDTLIVPGEFIEVYASAFNGKPLTSVIFEQGVSIIRSKAFANCHRLSSVEFPLSIRDIAKDAFNNTKVEKIILNNYKYSSNIFEMFVSKFLSEHDYNYIVNKFSMYKKMGNYEQHVGDFIKSSISYENGNLIINIRTIERSILFSIEDDKRYEKYKAEKDREERIFRNTYGIYDGELYKYNGPDTFADIPKEVTRLQERIFKNYKKLKEVNIQGTLEKIKDEVFWSCITLKTINLKEGLTYIGKEAFHNCKKLDLDTLPSTVKFIGKGAFESCESLTQMILPNSIETLEEGVFKDCRYLKKVVLPSHLKVIPDNFILNTIVDSIDIPLSVEEIGSSAFCSTRLKEIYIPDTVKKIGTYAFSSNYMLTKARLPRGLESIPNHLFASCSPLMDVEIPESVKVIEEFAFSGCNKMESINIPVGVESIRPNAFLSCAKLKTIKLPPKIKEISVSCFENCYELNNLVVPPSVDVIENNAFTRCYRLKSIYVPKGKKFYNLPRGLFVVKRYKPSDYEKIMKKVYG